MEEPEGIPGHAGASEWSRALHIWLRDCGLSFEAEGEATRISLPNGVTVELTESEEGFAVVISLSLATRGEDLLVEAEVIAEAFWLAGKVAGKGKVLFDIDSSLPDYPILYITIPFNSPWEIVSSLQGALTPYCGEGVKDEG
ncbi:MAG: hypothetical protein F7C35_07125 [Desulfurococcales archaeon]|nr:hypothetical protein [Desulfurococcales archaeon]